MQADMMPKDRAGRRPSPGPMEVPPAEPVDQAEPTLMEGAVAVVFLLFIAVFGILGTLLAH
jgi:hypothetical protein